MSPTSIQLELSTAASVPYSPAALPVTVTFRNTGTAAVRLLDCFEPVPVFFAFDVVRADGTPLALPRGGKVDFRPEGIRYLKLPPGGSHSIRVDLAGLLLHPIQTGLYSVSATYRNQYGSNCLSGPVASNTIALPVTTGAGP